MLKPRGGEFKIMSDALFCLFHLFVSICLIFDLNNSFSVCFSLSNLKYLKKQHRASGQ